jgi:Gpi18-like mannosyltransferase
MHLKNNPEYLAPWRIGLWLSAVVMILSLFFAGGGQDIEFWRSWIIQLQTGGYPALDANYPPILLHWFRLFAWLNEYLGILPHGDWLVKGWTQLPVFISHLYLLDLVGKELTRQGLNPLHSATFWLTAFNPALLHNGPAWGQVDLLPFIPVYFSLVFAMDERRAHWSWPIMAIALLCKFQAIVFVPLLCGLSIRFSRRHAVGVLGAFLAFAIAFSPFFASGDAVKAFNRAYVDNLGIYPYSSLNAANLWYLLAGGSMLPDSASLLTGDWARLPVAHWLTPSKLGLGLFGLLSLIIAIAATRKKQLEDVYGLAVLSVVSFFAVSSGMHERYMFLAIPFAALWVCKSRQHLWWYPILTTLVFINMNFVYPLAGSSGTWNLISACVLLVLIFMLAQVIFNRSFAVPNWIAGIAERSPLSPYLLVFTLWMAFMSNEFRLEIKQYLPAEFGKANEIYASSLSPELQQQDYGKLKMDSNVDGGPLCLREHCYKRGLGTHARSIIVYNIPAEARKFIAVAGLDDESQNGEVEFIAEIDGHEAWRSGKVTWDREPIMVDIPLVNAKKLMLRVEPLGEIHSDHADWADARFMR